MASVPEGLVAHLLADGPVAALVGTRIYHEQMPQEPTYPVIVYQKVATDRNMTLGGPSGLTRQTYALDCFGDSSANVKGLADAVKNSLDGVTGNLGGATVQFVHYTDESDTSLYDGDKEYRIISLDVEIIFTE